MKTTIDAMKRAVRALEIYDGEDNREIVVIALEQAIAREEAQTVEAVPCEVCAMRSVEAMSEIEEAQAVEPTGLREAVAAVCEGWTLPAGARKQLESALWSNPALVGRCEDCPRNAADMLAADAQRPQLNLDRDASKPAEQQGLFRKFSVERFDRSDQPGCKHHGCDYFVLDVTHDQHAPAALRAYAESCKATHPQLSADLTERWGAQQVVSVDDVNAGIAEMSNGEGGGLDVVVRRILESFVRRQDLAQQVAVPQGMPSLGGDELKALHRFAETCEDGQEYDIPKAMMQRLAKIGVVRRVTASIYEETNFGEAVLAAGLQTGPGRAPSWFSPEPRKEISTLFTPGIG